MTIRQLSLHVNATARKAQRNGQTIEINYMLPYVAVNCNNGDEYFFQGDEASNLIDESRESKLHTYCSLENIILWQAQGW